MATLSRPLGCTCTVPRTHRGRGTACSALASDPVTAMPVTARVDRGGRLRHLSPCTVSAPTRAATPRSTASTSGGPGRMPSAMQACDIWCRAFLPIPACTVAACTPHVTTAASTEHISGNVPHCLSTYKGGRHQGVQKEHKAVRSIMQQQANHQPGSQTTHTCAHPHKHMGNRR